MLSQAGTRICHREPLQQGQTHVLMLHVKSCKTDTQSPLCLIHLRVHCIYHLIGQCIHVHVYIHMHTGSRGVALRYHGEVM